MSRLLNLWSIVCSVVVLVNAGDLPVYITPCSRSLSVDQLSECITGQARKLQPIFAKGIPDLGLEPLDPLTLNDLSATAGTFKLKSKNVVVKGLGRIHINEMKWNLKKMEGHTRIFGNLTFHSDYEADGRVLLIPITGTGKLTCKMYNTDMIIKWKIRTYRDKYGVEHLESYDYRPSQTYGHVNLRLSDMSEGSVIEHIINHVLNENWRDLMAEVGPPYTKAIAEKVHDIINKLYSQVSYDELLPA
ncbi:hypothetical protein NE865_12930 [Phthorimaea operculella]|nr:hypothetical protein NE865_12930 [Phthorimaea operculella]